MKIKPDVTLTLRPLLGEIHRVERAVSEFAGAIGLVEDRRFAIELALDELLTNTITHGYGDATGDGNIKISLRYDANVVHVEIEDDASRFDPFDAPPPDLEGNLDERRVGGLGIHFVRRFTDKFQYRWEGGRNIVAFDVAAPPRQQEETE